MHRVMESASDGLSEGDWSGRVTVGHFPGFAWDQPITYPSHIERRTRQPNTGSFDTD
jgi:hypothetical protein